MDIDLERDGVRRRAHVHRGADDRLTIRLDDGDERTVRVVTRDENTILLEIEGERQRLRWVRRGREVHLARRGQVTHVHWAEEDEADEAAGGGSPIVRAPMPGKVLEVTVTEGQTVGVDHVVARLEAMKMEISLTTASAGTIATVHVAAGDLVDPDAPIVTVAPADVES